MPEIAVRLHQYCPLAQPAASVQTPSGSPKRATETYAVYAEYVKLGGGAPQLVGGWFGQEQRPSPPVARAASIAAITLSDRSPGVAISAASAFATTASPARMLPWIA